MLDTSTAEHEAAHVVVGLALKLKLVLVSASPVGGFLGVTQFRGQGRIRRRVAFGVMYCAGPAWERRPGGNLDHAVTDLQLAHKLFGSLADVQTGIRLAEEILAARKGAHALVTRELCERGRLTARDLEALVREL